MFGLGAGELLLIGIIALIFIGPKKLPELAQGLGRALREFQKAKDDFQTTMAKEVGHQDLHKDLQKDLQKFASDLPAYKVNTVREVPVPPAVEKKPEV